MAYAGKPLQAGEVEERLAEYRIGAKLRTLRKKRDLTLRELASITGLSISGLSQIESGQIPSLLTLLHLADVLGGDLVEILTPNPADIEPDW